MTIELTDQERCEFVARVIDGLLKEHELAGFFVIAAPKHGTHGLVLNSAPWLRLSLHEDTEGVVTGVRVRSKLDEYQAGGMAEDDARALQQREMQYTISAVDHMAMQCAPVGMLMLQALELLHKRFEIETHSKRVGYAGGKLQ